MELLERHCAQEDLRLMLRNADRQRGSLLLLGGEAGVGKTSLLQQFSTEARSSARVLIGHCDALSTPRALGPLYDIADPTLERLLADHAPRETLLRALLASFAARPQATLLAIEDAHWADEATLDLLRYLGRRIANTRAMLVVTYRDDEIGPRHPLQRLLGDLATTDAVQRMVLRPLTLQAVSAMAAGSELDATELFARTRGNPFFVSEVLAAGGAIPPNVRDAVLARASRLSPSAWTVLMAAAVIGSPITLELLGRVVAAPAQELESCLERGMLRAEGCSVMFRHELVREAILGAIPAPQRAALHRDVLRVLEAAPPHAHVPARLAHHAEEAGDVDAVLRHAPEAARRATLLGAHREAAAQYERVLRVATALPPQARAHVLEARSYACYLTAQLDEGIAARQEALAIWIERGDRRREGENRCHLATLYWAQARVIDAENEAEAAVALMEQIEAGPELAMAYGTLARLRGTTLTDNNALRLGEKAVALAARFGTMATHIDALLTVGEAKLAKGMTDVGQEQIALAMRLAEDAGLDGAAARAYISLGYGFAESGQLEVARQHFECGIRYCVERDLDLPLHHITSLLARCHLSLGNWDEARCLAHTVLSAREVAPGTRFEALLVAGLVAARRGGDDAWPWLDEARELAMCSGCIYYLAPLHAARAEAAFLAGNLAVARAEARAVSDLAIERGHTRFAGELAYWRWKCGDSTTAPSSLAAPFFRQIAGDWAGAAAAWEALGCPYEAARARAEGENEAALRGALATFEQLGALPAAACARRHLLQRGARRVPRGPRPSTRANPAGVTVREAEVLGLLATGCGNGEIAGRLFLSPRTVEHHIASILTKLGATSRGEAGEAARRLGLVP